MFMYFHAYVPSILYILFILILLVLFYLSLSLSLPLSPSCVKSALWHPNTNPLRPRTLFVLGHPFLLLILPLLTYSSMMIKPEKTFRRTFHDATFIWNSKLFYRIFLILTFPLSSTIGVGGHFVTSRSLVHSWSYKSFSPICTNSILLYLIFSLAFEVCAL